MNKTRWIIFTVVVVGFLGALILFSDSKKLDVSKIDAFVPQLASADNGNIADHVLGKSDSKVTLIEYGDYQCPGCSSVNPNIDALVEQYKDQIQFIFRNFPISGHANSKAASGAVESAGLQGKFWEMHSKVYAGQSDWSTLDGNARTDFFVNYAKELGLDSEKFKTDMASKDVIAKINYDQALGNKSAVKETPSFYINGEIIDSDTISSAIRGDMTELKNTINAEIAKSVIEPSQTSN